MATTVYVGCGCCGGVSIACCEDPVPNVLQATLENVSGCECLHGQTVELTYDGDVSWEGLIEGCEGGPDTVALNCGGTIGDWLFNAVTPNAGGSCSPVNLVYAEVELPSCGTYKATITE